MYLVTKDMKYKYGFDWSLGVTLSADNGCSCINQNYIWINLSINDILYLSNGYN
jgi:hypothetical protein